MLIFFSKDILIYLKGRGGGEKTDNLNKAHGSRHSTLRKGQHFHKLDTLTDEATSLWHSCMT